jgi:ATP-binding cassette subfamily B (MDR/TAP) protein 9
LLTLSIAPYLKHLSFSLFKSRLDAESEYLVQQAIHKNLKGHTVVVVAHRLSTIENADKIIVLDHGNIVEQGTHRELLKRDGLYAQLVKKQMHTVADRDSVASTPTPSLSYLPSFKTKSLDSYHTSV